MVSKSVRLLILPFLFALLVAGGNATWCHVLSMAGLDAHHHRSVATGDTGNLCCETHEETHEEEAPCPETCEIALSEAPAPALSKLPCAAETALPAFIHEFHDSAILPALVIGKIEPLEPPDIPAVHSNPVFTGCFLI